MLRSVFVSLAGVAFLAGAASASAQHISCAVTGAKQGAFQTNHGFGGDPKQIPVLFLTEEVTTPFDTATGHASGRRTHTPLTIVKTLDPTSIDFFMAAVNLETLSKVTCTLYRDRGEGTIRAYFRITLTNAIIVDYKDAGDGLSGDARDDERERISLTYQKIELTDLDSSISALDDWAAQL
jgi:type VI secretion system secreted protein Hcp